MQRFFTKNSYLLMINRNFFSNNLLERDTIYALSTGLNSAISIIRISGEQSYKTLYLLDKNRYDAIVKSEELLKINKIKQRYAHLRNFYNKNGKIIDKGLLLYFPKKCSYNKQQIYELHLHGSKAIATAIFKQLDSLNMRMAKRGEFTKRALVHGNISIHQAQAINDLIRSQSQFTRQIAMNNLLGKSSDYLHKIKSDLVLCLAKNEAYIDFQQEQSDVKEDLFDKTKNQVNEIIKNIENVLRNYKNLQIVKDGVNVAIFGRPNAGKSTLINQLAQKQVSIVNQQPGTTRDIIQTSISISDIRVNLLDTAGIRNQTQSSIQLQGIRRAKKAVKDSHFKLMMIDWTQENHEFTNGQLIIILEELSSQLKIEETIFIINKADLLPETIKMAKIKINNKLFQPVLISAKKSINLEEIVSKLQQKLEKQYHIYKNSEEIYITRKRYFDQLQQCKDLLMLYIEQQRPDIACQYVRLAIRSIQQIFGRVDSEDVLDVLFRQFCIGK